MFSKQDTHYFSLTWIPELGGVQELAEGEEEGRTLLVPLSTFFNGENCPSDHFTSMRGLILGTITYIH